MEQQKEFTGVWIPRHVIEDDELSMTDKIIYAEIACFDICFKSNEKLGERYGLKANTISIIISKLVNKGYIDNLGVSNGRNRHLIAKKDKPNQRQGMKKIKGTLSEKSKAPFEKNQTIDNSIENNIDNNLLAPQAGAGNESSQIPLVLKEFESLNLACKNFYGNKTQRKAVQDLIDVHGYDRVVFLIREVLPKSNKVAYMPNITTPVQLRDGYAKLENALHKHKSSAQNNKYQVTTV